MTAPDPPVRLKGNLKPDGTLELDHAPALPPGPVEVIIRPATKPAPGNHRPGENLVQYVERVRAEAEAAGYRFQTNEEMAAELEAVRSWDLELPPLKPEDKNGSSD